MGLRDRRKEGHESGSAEELGHEKGGVSLSLRALKCLKTLPENAVVIAALSEYSATVAAHNSVRYMHKEFGLRERVKGEG